MLTPKTASRTEPVAVLGAGDLVSPLHRDVNADDAANYRFSVFRLSQDLQATHELRPCDLHDLVKLCQVLTFAIVDDGWISTETRNSLRGLFDELDTLTQRWSNTDNG
jgi:hypothetical protein